MKFTCNYVRNVLNVALGRQPVHPLLFSYYVTHRCNLNCRYCSDGEGKHFSEDKVEELNTADAKRLISIIAQTVDTLDITGGEPLLRDDLAELLSHAQKVGLRTVLNTKGIDLEKRPDVIRHTDVMIISLDSPDVTRLSELIGRPPAVAEGIIRALNYLIANRSEFNVRIVVSAVATPFNLPDVKKVMDFAGEHNLAFHVSPEIAGTSVNPALRDNMEYRQLIDDVIKRKARQNGILGVKQYLYAIRDFRDSPCHPMLMTVIRPDGRMYYPCIEVKQYADASLLECGSYSGALKLAVQKFGSVPECKDRCHIFCHMGLSLLQRHPLAAVGESKHWSR